MGRTEQEPWHVRRPGGRNERPSGIRKTAHVLEPEDLGSKIRFLHPRKWG